MATRPPRIETGVIVKALKAHIETLQKTPVTSDKYGEAAWEIMRLEGQIDALNYRPEHPEMLGWGGNWLGTVRSWIQLNFRNGSDVEWSSHQTLHPTSAMTPNRLERLAALIASEAVKEHMGLAAPKSTPQG